MKHRAKHPIRDIATVLTFVVFVAAVGAFAINEFNFLLGGGSAAGADTLLVVAEPIPLGQPVASETPSPETTHSPQPTQSPLPTQPARAATPLSVPLQLTIPAIAIDQQPITEYTDEMLAARGEIKPEGMFTISWWSGGGRPGASEASSLALTTFLYGHATNRPDKKVIFDDIDLLAAGDEVRIETDHGAFTYAVETVFTIPKSEMPTDPRTCENSEGRLLLVSCWSESPRVGASAADNVVAVAWLTSAPPPAE